MQNIKNIFTNWLFYVYFVGFIMFFNYITTGNVFSFGNFGKWMVNNNIIVSNDYVKKSNVDNLAVGLTFSNLSIAKGELGSKQILGKALEYINEAETLINVDSIGLLDNSVNKVSIFETHLKQIENVLSSLSDLGQQIKDIAQEKNQLSQNCKNEKSTSDRDFFQGLNNNDSSMLKDGFENSLDNGKCFEENRVAANAYLAVYDKLDYYRVTLQKKYDIFENNKDMIIQNYEYFKDSYLENLLSIKNQLSKYNFR